MKPLFKNLPNYKDIAKLHLFNGAIANPNRIYLLGRIYKPNTRDSKIKKRVLMYQRDNPAETQLQVVADLKEYKDIKCVMSYNLGEQLFLYNNGNRNCIIKGLEVVNEQDEHFASLHKSRLIGQREYITTTKRRVLYRDDTGQHQVLGEGQGYKNYETFDRPLNEDGEPDFQSMHFEDGFIDVDGFDENHIYAVGGYGDVWRYIDGTWTKCSFPSNLRLRNVCCGEDGLVYISGLEGMTYVGIEDNWKALKNPEFSIPFQDVAWYDGKVWATNDYGTWWITPKGITEAKIPYEVKVCSGSLKVNAGMLLLVGLGGAALLENGKWQILFKYEAFMP